GIHSQAITTAPVLVRHPTRKGYLVIFGTGQYFENGHKTPETNHPYTLYGIWDEKTKAESTGVDTITVDNLQKQTITSSILGHNQVSGLEREARVISNTAVEWYKDYDSSKERVKRGWSLNFKAGSGLDGEMVIADPKTLGAMVLISTLVPNDDPCANGSSNWTYAINPATGGRTTHHAFDTRGADGSIVSAIRFGTEGGVSITQDETGFGILDPSGKEGLYPPPSSLGRQSWRMIQNP
ncbi:MAG: PilC/PilY family type IV pilus protein, partial [Thiopseudomonas sp.]